MIKENDAKNILENILNKIYISQNLFYNAIKFKNISEV